MLRTLFKRVREYKFDSIMAMIMVVFEVAMEVLIPFFMSGLLNEIQKFNSISEEMRLTTVYFYSGLLVAMAFASLTFGILSGKFAAKASAGFAKNLRHDLFVKVNDFSFNNIDKYSSSSLVTRLTTDVGYVQMAFMMIIRTAVRSPIMLIFSVIMAYLTTPRLAWIFVIAIPFIILGFGIIIRFALPTFKKIFKKYDKMNESVQENIGGIRTVKSYVREDYEKAKFFDKSNGVKNDFTRAEKIVALNSPIFNIAIYGINVVIVFVGALLIVNTAHDPVPAMQVGDLSALLVYGIQSLMSLMMFSMIFVMVIMSVESCRRITEVLNEVPTIKNYKFELDEETKAKFYAEAMSKKTDKEKFDSILGQELSIVSNENYRCLPLYSVNDGSVEFKNVSFKYYEEAPEFALSDINLKVNSGETIGILGSTGSSKSTLVNLISRLYDPTIGEVKVGGENVKNYDLKTLRDNVSVVLQKNLLFKGTIKENLKWGNENASDEEIIEACKLACADEFIETFPDKYDYQIEQGGINVSGGQKQRLCIARALLKKPKILILDDSTSAVDTRTDAIIRKGMRTYLPSTTKFIIAQRVSSVMDADKIIIMNNGKIEDIGTHDELLTRNEMYIDLYDYQIRRGSSVKEGK